MKKAFLILMLLMAINLTAPAGNTLYQRQRHLIEFAQEINYRNVSDDEVLKKKAVMYIRLAILINMVLIIDRGSGQYYNTS